MKHTLLVPIRFLLVTLAVLLVVTLLAGAVDQGRGAGMQGAIGDTTFLRSLLFVLPVTLPLSVIAAIPIDLFLILRKPGIPALSLLLLFLTAGALQYASGLLATVDAPETPELGLFRAGLLIETPEYTFSFRGRSGSSLEGVLLVESDSEPRFSVHPEGFLDLQGRRLLLPREGRSLPLRPQFAPSASLYAPPAEIGGFVTDLTRFAGSLRRLDPGLDYLLLVGSTTLLFVSLWTLARATTWKLLNLLLVGIAVRLFFLLFGVLNSDLVSSLAEQELPPGSAAFLVPGVSTVIALLLLVVALLLPPLKEWKRGVGDA